MKKKGNKRSVYSDDKKTLKKKMKNEKQATKYLLISEAKPKVEGKIIITEKEESMG